ncbi:MAG: maleylacetoacetate isomerase [Betaproteobacteria bacterium]|jgi:maleylacetoacetate isomerase|nr:maleylacetoacetate isomerase [Betaproteobacteria bacterium]
MELYTYFRSSAAFRVRIALNLKGLAYHAHTVHLRKSEHRAADYLAVNPQGLVPTLIVDGHRLTQSLAILEYLEERHPRPALLPGDALGRARVRALADLVACEIHPLNNLRTLEYLRSQLGQDEAGIATWYRHWIADGLEKLEAALTQDRGAGIHCHGDQPTIADCCLVPQIFNARRFDSDLTPYPTTMRIFEACMRLDAFQRAQPSAQPDAE